MIASTAFVLGFILIALTVLFLAMRGGARGARDSLHGQSRGARKVSFVGIALVIVVMGVAVPALVLAGNDKSQSEQSPGGVKLTAGEKHGRQLFAKNCNTCHTLRASNGQGKVGPNLDAL